jgi:hypothetical protein
MKDVTDKNFGVIIAFLLPGFLLLWGLTYSHDELGKWLTAMSSKDAPLIGSFLFATIASLALGLIVSAFRLAIFDWSLYKLTRLKRPRINSSKLKNKDTLEAWSAIIENHYRYYQYYANCVVAIAAAFGSYLVVKGPPAAQISVLVVVTLIVLGWAAREELRSFNERAEDITR